MNNIVEKSFYITSLFASIKSEHNWTSNEVKTVLLMFSKMDKYKLYIPDFSNNEALYEAIKKIPNVYKISKDEFIKATGIRKDNASREINNVRKKLVSKVIHTPHPFEDDADSGESISWFKKISYSSQNGEVTLEVNEYALERLIAFVKYSKISFENIVRLKSSYSIYTYLFLKIIKDISYKEKLSREDISIEEFKEKLSLKNKYKDINLFRLRVLDVITKEINDYTDMIISYDLIKEGRAYSKIRFDFDYKDKALITNETDNDDKSNNLFGFEISDSNEDSYFEAILTSWGIRAKKVVEIEESYSIDAINEAIEVTKQAIDSDSIKTTPAAFFIGTLENKELQSQVEFEREQLLIREQQEKERKAALLAEYEAIEKFINDNSDEISNYLSISSGGGLFELSRDVKEQLENLSCVDIEKFKDFRSKFVVLEQGFWDMKQRKEIRPNMYQFLKFISFYNAI
ncbi:replication initiation protein [Francisella sp. XLW-1]|uniref:replication initiation protein n=1 Tax=Francisella sp. XLW-1 TaxID=2610887 RepID=UPI00123CB53C|nr:replication initiation protein [Francisella sp. XLW-1]